MMSSCSNKLELVVCYRSVISEYYFISYLHIKFMYYIRSTIADSNVMGTGLVTQDPN